MKIAIVGAAGHVGRRVTDEAVRRGHEVVAVVRHADASETRPAVHWVTADANDAAALAAAIRGSDAVVTSVPFVGGDPRTLLTAVRESAVSRYLIVGGAGSLLTEDGQVVCETPGFERLPWAEEARRGKAFLDILRSEAHDLAWTMLCPSQQFVAGERTGSFRLDDDVLLTGADGKSWISYEDYAVALLDEIEHPAHVRARFTVGY